MRRSLRLRLLVLILLPLILVSSLAVIWRYTVAKQTAEEIFDRNLVMLTFAISRDVALSEGDSLSQTTANLFRAASGGQVFYHVYGPDGSFITGYSSPPVGPARANLVENRPSAFTSTHLGLPVRVVQLAENTQIGGITGTSVVTVWRALDLRERFARNLALRAGALAALLVLTVAGLVLFGIRLGLQPLAELEEAIQKRSSDDLSPILRQVPVETKGIVSRLNTLFAQLTESKAARDRFISNAAHQLRNPIAGIHAMAQATQNADTLETARARAAELVAETRRTGRLTQQLLSLERLNGQSPALARLDLNTLITDIGTRNAAQILAAGLEFSVLQSPAPAIVNANARLLTEAVQNLLDNALSHGGAGLSQITLSIETQNNAYAIIVENDGTPIPDSQKNRIFERFIQGEESDGSGLGLAIVAEIIRLNNGTLSLQTQPATRFELRFPETP